MTVSFYLTRPNSETETSIFARICYNGYKVKWYTPESINPKYWNKEAKLAKKSDKFREYPEFNQRLKDIRSDIGRLFRKWVNDKGHTPAPETLKELLDKELKKQERPDSSLLLDFFKRFIEDSKTGARLNPVTGKPLAPNTLKTYTTVYNHLAAFQEERKRKIDFDSVNKAFHDEYMAYLSQKLKLSTNTIGGHIKALKLIMGEASEKGLTTNQAFKSKGFVKLQEETENIYLPESELEAIAALDLSNDIKLDRVRDLFLIGCYTGLRFSDFSTLKGESIHNGFIRINQVKTGKAVTVPMHDRVRLIFEKYNGNLPPAISNQKTNEYLKEIGKKVPELAKTFTKTITKGGEKVSRKAEGGAFHKWELLSTHTARRSFATNQYLRRVPTITIMAVTGHRTEKAFLKYIKLAPDEHAKLMQDHWNNSKAVIQADADTKVG